jgi:hypothetical protein
MIVPREILALFGIAYFQLLHKFKLKFCQTDLLRVREKKKMLHFYLEFEETVKSIKVDILYRPIWPMRFFI